jgi:hypothetical protein
VFDSGLEYVPGDPVTVRVVERAVHDGVRTVSVTDDSAAAQRAGRRAGWRSVGERVADELLVNVGRDGAISLPVVRVGPGQDAIAKRIAAASLALYQELLELE